MTSATAPAIRAVLFDLDETLILDEPVSQHAFAVVATLATADLEAAVALAEAAEASAKALWAQLPAALLAYASQIGHSALEGLWADYDLMVEAEAQLASVIGDYRRNTWQLALEQTGLQATTSADATALAQRWAKIRAQFPLFPDTNTVLATLKRQGYRLGIVTNGVRLLQQQKLIGSGLGHWFDAVAISGALGIGKPKAAIFDWVAAQLGVAPNQCLMVGDNSERDVQGAINAGMASIWLERGYKPSTVAASHHCQSLGGVLTWLEHAPLARL
jgi:putative hydrolase of the HAD superfamily